MDVESRGTKKHDIWCQNGSQQGGGWEMYVWQGHNRLGRSSCKESILAEAAHTFAPLPMFLCAHKTYTSYIGTQLELFSLFVFTVVSFLSPY